MRIRKSSFAWLLLTATLVLVISGCAPKVPASQPAAPETQGSVQANELKTGPFKDMLAPDFKLMDMAGTEWTLSQLKGSSVALVFFTSW